MKSAFFISIALLFGGDAIAQTTAVIVGKVHHRSGEEGHYSRAELHALGSSLVFSAPISREGVFVFLGVRPDDEYELDVLNGEERRFTGQIVDVGAGSVLYVSGTPVWHCRFVNWVVERPRPPMTFTVSDPARLQRIRICE